MKTQLREARLEDHAAIMAVQLRNGLTAQGFDDWSRRWTENPAYVESPLIPMGWVVEDGEGQIVGTLGNIPCAYEWNGRRLLAAISSSWAVDPSHRNAALGQIAKFFTQKGVDLLFNTTANKASGAVCAAFRAEPIPCPGYIERRVWITNYPGFAAGRLHRRNLPGGEMWKYPAALGLWGLDRLRGRNRLGRASAEVRPSASVDERFDAFWNRLRRRPDRLMAVRDRACLDWHLRLSSKGEPATILVLLDRSGAIAGYVALARRDESETNLKRLEVIDLQVLDEDSAGIAALTSSALRHARDQGIHAVGVTGWAASKRKALDALRPYRSEVPPPWPLYYKALEPAIRPALAATDAWDPSPFDGDTLWG